MKTGAQPPPNPDDDRFEMDLMRQSLPREGYVRCSTRTPFAGVAVERLGPPSIWQARGGQISEGERDQGRSLWSKLSASSINGKGGTSPAICLGCLALARV
jgi:hypothetical protein